MSIEPDDSPQEKGQKPGDDDGIDTGEEAKKIAQQIGRRFADFREEMEDEVADLRDQLDQKDERIEQLEQRIDELENQERSEGQQRSRRLIAHLRNKALHRNGQGDRARVDRDQAEAALNHPDVDRSTIYRDMERAARLVGDEDVLEYDDGKLTLDLEAGDLPARFTAIDEE